MKGVPINPGVFEPLPLEYSERVGQAGNDYICGKALRNDWPLPATFRWQELFEVMQRAALEDKHKTTTTPPAFEITHEPCLGRPRGGWRVHIYGVK